MAANIATSLFSTFVRANSGIQSTPAAEKPDLMLQLYDIENCPYCRLVREALTELAPAAEIYPCPKQGERFRLHDDKSGERLGFTMKEIETCNSEDYRILLPSSLRSEMTRNLLSLYRVDVSGRNRPHNQKERLRLPLLSSSSAEASHIRVKSRKTSGLIGLQNRSNKESTPQHTPQMSKVRVGTLTFQTFLMVQTQER